MNKSENSQIFTIIESLCKESGVTVSKVCADITGNKSNLPTWKKGSINTKSLLKLSDYFGVTTDYILGKTTEPNCYKATVNITDDSIMDNSTNKKNGIIIGAATGDEFISNFLKQFGNLNYQEQLEIINLVNEKTKKESE